MHVGSDPIPVCTTGHTHTHTHLENAKAQGLLLGDKVVAQVREDLVHERVGIDLGEAVGRTILRVGGAQLQQDSFSKSGHVGDESDGLDNRLSVHHKRQGAHDPWRRRVG